MISKRGMIPSYALFCLFFVSRTVVSLTYNRGVSVGKLGADVLVSLALSLAMLILFSMPAYMCIKNKKSPLDNRFSAALYVVYFCFFAAVTVSRFADFASDRMNTNLPPVVVVVLFAVAMCYGAYLGVESIGRFGFLCAVAFAVTLVAVVGLNVGNLVRTNFYPLVVNTDYDILRNAVLFTSNSAAPVFLLALSDKVNGNIAKPYFLSLVASYGAVMVLVLFCVGVMGSSAQLQSYPIYTLFQMASIGTFSRLDALHTAFWILAVLLKSALFVYCASVCYDRFSHSAKCIVFGSVSAIVALVMTGVSGVDIIGPTKIISVVGFCVFAVVLPLVSLLGRTKNEKN